MSHGQTASLAPASSRKTSRRAKSATKIETLYHGTTLPGMSEILYHGLRPNKKDNRHPVTRADGIYLTDLRGPNLPPELEKFGSAYDYGLDRAVRQTFCRGLAIIHVDVSKLDETQLMPAGTWLRRYLFEEAIDSPDGQILCATVQKLAPLLKLAVLNGSSQEMVKEIRNRPIEVVNLMIPRYQHFWQRSIEERHEVFYFGEIPTTCFSYEMLSG